MILDASMEDLIHVAVLSLSGRSLALQAINGYHMWHNVLRILLPTWQVKHDDPVAFLKRLVASTWKAQSAPERARTPDGLSLRLAMRI